MGFLKREMKTIIVAVVAALVAVGGPAVGHGVQHALFAHNATRLDGFDSRAFQLRSNLMWAVVDADGSLLRERGVILSEEADSGAGTYEVKFERNVNKCAWSATVAAEDSSFAYIKIAAHEDNDRLFVSTGNFDGDPFPNGFHIWVVC